MGNLIFTYCSLTLVQQIRVTWPPATFNLANFLVIFDQFTQLQELVMEFPGYEVDNIARCQRAHSADLLTAGNMLSSRGACCMSSDTNTKAYISPTAELVERTSQPSLSNPTFVYFCGSIHQEFLKDVGKIIQQMAHETFALISIWREPGDNKELSEEDVAAANYILDLMADSRRRGGGLDHVIIPKVDITHSDWLTIYIHGIVLYPKV